MTCGWSAPHVCGVQWTVREPTGCLARQGGFIPFTCMPPTPSCKQQVLSAVPSLPYLQPEPDPALPVTAMTSPRPACPGPCLSNSAPTYIHTDAGAAFLRANPTVSLPCKCLQQQFSQVLSRRIDCPPCKKKKCRCPARQLPF